MPNKKAPECCVIKKNKTGRFGYQRGCSTTICLKTTVFRQIFYIERFSGCKTHFRKEKEILPLSSLVSLGFWAAST
jgi:hypothetical protein